ncbi:hypothetical protein A176_006309 [Myxococcus hansupus]|uniref:Uncharacterized protein n=1 Tax=Pseudomyxococcus hansupus TaxID=1297742 RepID=A0A0H4XM77_9BACT|nr:hypothetical protein A176_006309 [Myxococcus hansupus]
MEHQQLRSLTQYLGDALEKVLLVASARPFRTADDAPTPPTRRPSTSATSPSSNC